MKEIIVICATEGDGLYEQIISLLHLERYKGKSVQYAFATELQFENLRIDYSQREAYRTNQAAGLFANEFMALWYMASNAGHVFTKEQIYEYVYQEEPIGEIGNSLYCLIRNLRKKLESDPRYPQYIHTVRGIGYKFEALSEE